MPEPQTHVIVGGGLAGAKAAEALRTEGFEGRIILLAEETEPPYERPPLSKEALGGDAAPEPKWIGWPGIFAERNIACLTGRNVMSIDRGAKRIELSDGSRLAYERLLLATGATPRQLPLLAAAGASVAARCLTLRSFGDALAIRRHLEPEKRIAIVGGGFIGLELAASAVKRGATVTVIEALPRVLMRGVPKRSLRS